MKKFKVTYSDSIIHEIVVEAYSKEDASYKLPPWKPGNGSRRIISIEPFEEKKEYTVTYEHGDRYERKTETITVEATSIEDAKHKVPHITGDEFLFITSVRANTRSSARGDGPDR